MKNPSKALQGFYHLTKASAFTAVCWIALFSPDLTADEENHGVPIRDFDLIFSSNSHPISSPLYSWSYSFPKSHSMTIDGTLLGSCLATLSEIQPTLPYFSKNDMNCPYDTNEFFLYLMGNNRRKCDFSTGHEESLKKWVMSQEFNSINLHSIYQISFQLNNGNIWNSILTIHQLLRNMARFEMTMFYWYQSNSLEQEWFWEKFVDIRGDLFERGKGFYGDHPGSWYRLWGIVLKRLEVIPEQFEIPSPLSSSELSLDKKVRNFSEDLITKVNAIGAEIFKFFNLIPEHDKKKYKVNYQGAIAGNILTRYILTGNPNPKNFDDLIETCFTSAYLLEE